MRIEGMDAVSVSQPKTKSGNTSANEAVNTVVLDTGKEKDFNIHNLNQLNKFDRLDLPISDRVVIQAIEKANDAISVANKKFEYSIHEKTNQIMVKVIDTDTNEVIREIPPEKILDMVAKMWEMVGILVDERR